jgi:Spy/CpxP family protein refolding chaperone
MHGGMRHGMDFGLPPGEWWHNPMLATRIGLSADQIKHLDELSTQGKLDIIHLHAALEEDEVLLKPMLEGATLDEHKAEAQIDKIADARAAIEKAMAHNRLSERAVLTADQVTKLHDHSRPGMDRGMHRWGNGDNAPAPASGQ